jgi:two-component system, chemotaxis family, CheB/CheR fusion protein
VTFTDITELKRGEQDTRRLAAVMRACHDAIIVHDGEGRILSWSGGAEELYGLTAAEALGRNMALVIPPELQADYRMRLGNVMAGRPVEMEGKRRRKDGAEIEVSASLSLIPSGDGRPASIATIEHDITPRKIVENRLRESEQRFRMMADSAPVLVWISDAQGRIEFANNEFTSFVGIPLMELQGRRWLELLEHGDSSTPLKLSSESIAGRGGRIEITAKLTSARGEPRWMKVTALPRPHGPPEGAGVIGSMVDIHAQVEATQAMRTSNLRKDEFLAMLGHELRNPLVPVRNAAEVLRRVGLEDERLAWAHDTLVRQVGHITRLVDDLLDISRVTRGSLTLHVEPVDICHAVSSAIEATAPLLERKRHRLEQDLPACPLFVEGDAIRLVQVFENLLINAAKYTDEGGLIRIEMVEDGRDVVATVRDNGVGIAPAMAERIFDLFVQDARSVDRSQGGLGIGLSLVRHLVQLHNGTIEAHSEGEGRGSRFVVRMPRIAASQPAKPAHGHHVKGTGRVLIVDDDVAGGESIAMVVRMMGYETRFASDLAGALREAREMRPDVVLVDIAMPEADGYEVAARLRALPEMAKTAGYVALSGFGHPRDRKASERAGMAHHLVKPVEPDELERVLREMLGR